MREARGWSQGEVARRAQLRRATITSIEQRKTKGVDFDTLDRLACVFDVDPGYLIARLPSRAGRSEVP